MIYESVKNKVDFYVCDTTLRDGEQVAGIRYTPEQKVQIAKKLNEVGIDAIDAGFAATSVEERMAIKAICDLKLDMRIMSMCRVVKADVDAALECGVDGVILFMPSSDIHIAAKFDGDISENRKRLLQNSVDMIKYAKDKGLFVEFGVEDGTRTDKQVLLELFSKAEEVGADALGTTDTIGCLTPEQTYNYIKYLVDNLNTPIGVHCHNDLGLATANTLAGLLAGGGYCSPTVNGFGERAGNAALEEVLVALKVLYNQDIKYDLKKLNELSKMVQEYSGINTSIFKPIVGDNVFSHESGIHIHGMLKDNHTYEVYNPEIVGRNRKMVMGKHAGKHLIRHILLENGYDVLDDIADTLWKRMKEKEDLGISYSEEDVINVYRKEFGK